MTRTGLRVNRLARSMEYQLALDQVNSEVSSVTINPRLTASLDVAAR